MSTKIYYSVRTANEKIWIRADICEIIDGCLVFSDYADTVSKDDKVVITSFQKDYWRFVYEADDDSGESIHAQIPFWKNIGNSAEVRKGLPKNPEA